MTDERKHLRLKLSGQQSLYLYKRDNPGEHIELFNNGDNALRIGITAPIEIRITRHADDLRTDVAVAMDGAGLCLTIGPFETVHLWDAEMASDEDCVEIISTDTAKHRIVVVAPSTWNIYRHPPSQHVAARPATAVRSTQNRVEPADGV